MEEIIGNFMNVVKANYVNFDGRARRREYWMYILAYVLLLTALFIVAGILGAIVSFLGSIVGSIAGLVCLGLILPSIAVAVRRLHDTNKSGWFLLLAFVPFANFYLLYLLVIEGDKGSNQYGNDPKA